MPDTLKISGFTVTKIVIVQSLPAGELPTGKYLHDFIQPQIELHNRKIRIEFQTCTSASQFLAILSQLTHEAATQHEIPK